ncbi:hypothetical protein JG687_00014842 [Phytophthora cactorum]|uniref:Uncharacterized protein n=1 Tax=Phytophthora cactorum TaxID=29920 RepID=A0A8T1TZN1_9STRA|nr:hypothetical protein JG687_00014842 [Phytophthora cactorum]
MTLRQLCAFFYADHEKGLFECKMCGRGRKQASETGNSNLIDHLGTKHAGYVEEYAEIEATAGHGYMRYVACKVGQTIASQMGESFGLMFDGWTCNSLYLLDMFAVYVVNEVRHQHLLALFPIDGSQTAGAHLEHLASVLIVYGKWFDMARFFIGDNCSTNQGIATKLGPSEPTPDPRARADFVSTILRQAKKQRCATRDATQNDELLHLAPSASNACERLFSECKLVLTSLHSSTLPANFERIFVRANSNM